METQMLTIRLPREMHKQLKRLAIDKETSVQALMEAAAEKMVREKVSAAR